MIVVAHGGTVGLAVEIGSAVALGALLLWAVWRGRRTSEEDANDEGRP